LNLFEDGHQSLLRNDKCITITEEEAFLALAVKSGEVNVLHDSFIILDGKSTSLVHAAEGAFVVGAAGGNLKENRVSLTGRPEDITLILHNGT